jgi:hypothetical protein
MVVNGRRTGDGGVMKIDNWLNDGVLVAAVINWFVAFRTAACFTRCVCRHANALRHRAVATVAARRRAFRACFAAFASTAFAYACN